jgi:hypothetical protein
MSTSKFGKHSTKKETKRGPTLVEDVITIILQYLITDLETSDNGLKSYRKLLHRQLSNCALISRIWRLPVQRLLFTEVEVRSRRKFLSMQDVFSVKRKRGVFLRSAVRSLRILIDGQERTGNIRPSDLPVCMKSFPLLYELRLELDTVMSFSDSVMRALQSTPPIQALMLSQQPNRDRWIGERTDTYVQLLNHIPHWKLRHFVMSRGLATACAPTRYPPPRHQFIEVRFHADMHCQHQPQHSIIHWLIENSGNSLKILSISDDRFSPPIFSQANKANIISLEYSSILSSLSPLLFPNNLRELMWVDVTRAINNEQPMIPPSILSHFPSLTHVGLDVGQWRGYEGPTRWRFRSPRSKFPLPSSLRRITVVNIYLDDSEKQRWCEQILGGNVEIYFFENLQEYKRQQVSSRAI